MSKSEKNILFITPGFAESEGDTTCIPALQEFVKGLNQFQPKIAVTIISLHYPGKPDSYKWNGNEVISIGANNCRFPMRFFFWEKLKKKITGQHELKNFDLIHTFWFDEVTFVSSKIAKKLGIPLFCTFMGQDAIGTNRYVRRIEVPSTKLVALSSFHKEQILTTLNLKVDHIIPWGLSENLRMENQKEVDVVNVGSFNHVKNQNEAISIIKELQQVFPGIKCVFIGEGAGLQIAMSEVRSLGLENNITFKGKLSREETLNTIAKSKILLHCSNFESFGMIFAEAIENQTMIVSKKVGIAREEKWWKIYSSNNQAASQISQLLDKPVYPDSNEGRIYAIENTVDKYLKIWDIKKAARETLRPSNQ